MKVICESCDGYGEYSVMVMTMNGPDEASSICYECRGEGYFIVPNPNDLLKELL